MTRGLSNDVSVTSTCIGSGPRTDLLAIIASRKQLFEYEPAEYKFHLFDKEAGGESIIKAILGDDLHEAGIYYDFVQLDLSEHAQKRLVINLRSLEKFML